MTPASRTGAKTTQLPLPPAARAGDFHVMPVRSGSSGNMVLLSHGETSLLVDAGLPSRKALDAALAETGRAWTDISGILVSHLHSDHVNSHTVARCAEHRIPIFLHEKNRRMFDSRIFSRLDERVRSAFYGGELLRFFNGDAFTVGDLSVRAFQVPHDAVGITCGFDLRAAGNGGARVTMATDLGHGGDGLFEEFVDSDLILLEANHDEEMLAGSRRHDKARVGGDEGHLSNRQAGALLARAMIESRRPPCDVVLCHLSRDHNSAELAGGTVREILARHDFADVRVHTAPSLRPFPVRRA